MTHWNRTGYQVGEPPALPGKQWLVHSDDSKASTGHKQGDDGGHTRSVASGRRVLIDWTAVNAQLPIGLDPASKAARRKLFAHFDPNGNGILSLAEVDRGLKRVLQLGGVSQCTPAVHRAFHAARDSVKPVADFSNRYIDRNEFRFLLVYLRYYLELWEFFDMIDTSDDRRVRLREFQAALPFFRRWGLRVAENWEKDPRAVFRQIDRNGGGAVLFDEFADFCLRHGVQQAASEDDDADDRHEAFEALQNKRPNLYGNAGTGHSPAKTAPSKAVSSAPQLRPLVDMELLNKQLPIGRDQSSKSDRNKLFSRFDPNGNGVLSLAEVDRGIKRVLHFAGASECTPAIERAFHAARDIAPPVASFSNDYIDKNEFRVLLIYLKHYIELWQLFMTIDTSGDRRVRLKEFRSAMPLFRRWGLKEAASWDADPQAAFSKLDYNGGGVVLFDEFADFCLRAGMHDLDATDRHDDFQDRREALEALRNKEGKNLAMSNTTIKPPGGQAVSSTVSSTAAPQMKTFIDRAALNAQLPVGRDHASKIARARLFSRMDMNGNAIISLAEVDRGLKQVLQLAGIADCTPAINRAFHAARDIAPPVADFSNDYIDRNEFRVLLVYLKYYLMLWEFFATVDTSGDRRVRLREFKAAIPLFERWGLKEAAAWEAKPEETFKRMDYNGGGFVLFDEFADFCLRTGLKDLSGDDSQDRQEALDDLKLKQPNLCTKDLPHMRTREVQFGQVTGNGYPGELGSLSARGGKDFSRGLPIDQMGLGSTMPARSKQWESTYKRTFGTKAAQHSARGLPLTSPRSINALEAPPGKEALRSKLDQQMAMYNTGQLETMLKFAGGMIAGGATPR